MRHFLARMNTTVIVIIGAAAMASSTAGSIFSMSSMSVPQSFGVASLPSRQLGKHTEEDAGTALHVAHGHVSETSQRSGKGVVTTPAASIVPWITGGAA